MVLLVLSETKFNDCKLCEKVLVSDITYAPNAPPNSENVSMDAGASSSSSAPGALAIAASNSSDIVSHARSLPEEPTRGRERRVGGYCATNAPPMGGQIELERD